jgi:3-hydroxy-9,10-secoandrosta-1,3,5(10)-triene-9,17-dione monooxygenase
VLACSFLLPRRDYRIEDVWHVMGLKGTASNDIVVEDAFVPEHRVRPFVSGSPVSDAPLFDIPFAALFGYSLTAPIIGMAQGALDAHLEWTSERVRLTAGSKVAEETFSQIRVAEASGAIDAARNQMHRTMDDLLCAAEAGDVPLDLRARARRDQVLGTRLAVQAIDRVFENSGAAAISDRSVIQRLWRDAHAAAMHNSNVPEPVLAAYGAKLFGLPAPGAPF